jgi:hypothetical protein
MLPTATQATPVAQLEAPRSLIGGLSNLIARRGQNEVVSKVRKSGLFLSNIIS